MAKALTAAQMTNRDRELLALLRTSAICSESGDMWTDFENQNRDSLDFASGISRKKLERMLRAAWEAGLAYNSRGKR